MELSIYNKQDTIHQNVGQSKKFEKTLYVSLEGDDSDGLSWETAYNTFQQAYSDAVDNSIIYMGIGMFDVETALYFKVEKLQES